MIKYFLVIYFINFAFVSNSQNKVEHSICFSFFESPTGFSPGIFSPRSNNVGFESSYQLSSSSIGIGLSLTSGFRQKANKINKTFFAENYYLFDLSFFYRYEVFSSKRHYLHHKLGTFLFKNFISESFSVDVDRKFFESISIFSSSTPSKPSTMKSYFGFLETGYDFYVYKGLHLSVTGRATLLSYNLNYDSNGNPTDEKRLGLNYMLFYGLGYTFGRD